MLHRLRRASYSYVVVPLGQAVTGIIQQGMALQYEIDLHEVGTGFYGLSPRVQVRVPADGAGLVRRAEHVHMGHEPAVSSVNDLDVLLATLVARAIPALTKSGYVLRR